MIQRHFPTRINHRIVEGGGIMHFGGLIADDLAQDMKGQTAQICAKIDKLLAEVGSSKEKLVTAMLYITDFDQKEGMNEAWLEWLPAEHLPTRATIGVAELGKDVLIEIVVSAVRWGADSVWDRMIPSHDHFWFSGHVEATPLARDGHLV